MPFPLVGIDGERQRTARGVAASAAPSDQGGQKAPGGPMLGRDAEDLGQFRKIPRKNRVRLL
jgi:hypothetical protein